MNETPVTKDGLVGPRPGREALPGGTYVIEGPRRERRGKRAHDSESDEFRSYYGRPIIKAPVWAPKEIAGYFFLGGLAGASSLVAAGAELTGRPNLARRAKVGAAGAIGLSLAALIKDLGRPARFLNMLRVVKPTSPMNVGTWLVSAYAPAAIVAALSDAVGGPALVSTLSTGVAAGLGPCVAAYTGVLIADTAVPVWHGAHRQLPSVFVASAATAAAGLGLAVAPVSEAAPAKRLAFAGVAGELLAALKMERHLGDLGDVYHRGVAGKCMAASKLLAIGGALLALVPGRHRAMQIIAGVALMSASACTRFGIFFAGVTSSADPAATVGPQQRRLASSPAADEVA